MYKTNPHRRCNKQHGNALVYILIAIALMGFLTYTLVQNNNRTDNLDISSEEIDILATDILNYANAAKNAIDQMIISGADPDDIDFVRPQDAAFNTAPHIDKLYHPQGGGLQHIKMPEKMLNDDVSPGSANIFITANNNIEWTPTTTNDIVLVFFLLREDICQQLNKRIMGSTTIPSLPGNISAFFTRTGIPSGGAFTPTTCPSCEGYAQMCIVNNTNNGYMLYSILLGR